ncbi:Cytochrome P460 [Rhabdaerophilaceae bacterium]
MRNARYFAALAAVVGFSSVSVSQTAPTTTAEPDTAATRISFPSDYATAFKRYDMVDKVDRKIVRFLYINPQALAAVKPGEPFPDGTILVMEDHEVALEAGGTPIKGKDGRLQPTSRIKAIAVMEKRTGWGATNAFPPEKDNGDWEYASFKPDWTANRIKLDNCYSCHLPQTGLDFTFSGAKIFEAARK